MSIHSSGTYPRNTVNIAAGLTSIIAAAQPPQAVVMIGTALPLARFVATALNTTALRNAWFLTVSFVGTEAFQTNLLANGVPSTTPVFVSQVVVSPQDPNIGAARSYRDAITALFPTDPHTRFVVGLFILFVVGLIELFLLLKLKRLVCVFVFCAVAVVVVQLFVL